MPVASLEAPAAPEYSETVMNRLVDANADALAPELDGNPPSPEAHRLSEGAALVFLVSILMLPIGWLVFGWNGWLILPAALALLVFAAFTTPSGPRMVLGGGAVALAMILMSGPREEPAAAAQPTASPQETAEVSASPSPSPTPSRTPEPTPQASPAEPLSADDVCRTWGRASVSQQRATLRQLSDVSAGRRGTLADRVSDACLDEPNAGLGTVIEREEAELPPLPTPSPDPTPTAEPIPVPTAVPTAKPTVAPTPAPTPKATTAPPTEAVLEALSVSYTTETFVGGSIYLEVTIENVGGSPSEPVKFQIGGIKDYADLNGCIPICSVDDFFGAYFTGFETGVAAGQTATFEVELIAVNVGVADWSVMIYEGDGKDIYYGTAKTVIR